MSLSLRYAHFTRRFRYGIFAFWLIVAVAGVVWGLKFLDVTTSNYDAPDSSPSVEATDKLNEHFPQFKNTLSMQLLLRNPHESETAIVDLDGFEKFELELSNATVDKFGKMGSTGFIRSVSSYWPIVAQYNATQLAAPINAQGGTATLVSVTYDSSAKYTNKQNDLIDFLDHRTHTLLDDNELGFIDHGVTGILPFANAITSGVSEDLHLMDTVILPIALVILGLVVQNLALLIVPIMTVVLTILGEFLIMYPVALRMDVVTFTPSIMMSLTIAMSIDYSLFLLSRFMEEIKKGRSVEQAIELMLDGAGHTILVSGSTLILCFLGMLFFPMVMLQSVGIGASATLLVALSVNLSLIPAVLYSCGAHLVACQVWLDGVVARCVCKKDPQIRQQTWLTSIDADVGGQGLETPLNHPGDNASESSSDDDALRDDVGDAAMSTSWWYKGAWELVNPKTAIIVIILATALCTPICYYCLDVETSISFDLTAPEDSEAMDVFDDMANLYGQGTVFPYTLVAVPNDIATVCPGQAGGGETIMCSKGINTLNDALKNLSSSTARHASVSYSGLSVIDGEYVPFSDYESLFQQMANNQGALPSNSYDSSLYLAFNTYCEVEDRTSCVATYVNVILDRDVYSESGLKWLADARKFLDDDGPEGWSFYLAQGAGTLYDASNAVYDMFPVIIAITLGVVFVFMALAFRSLVAAVRSVVTLSLTLSFVFGLAVLVYQHGAFEWVGLRCVSNTGQMCWLTPVMCFSIIVGLGLDYDVFLIARVYEYRSEGYTDRAAAIKGIYSTGYIITAAGVIMAISFGGLFTSSEIILNQAAFLLVFAVLLDTFVVRTLCVPALLGLTDKYTWWPNPMPTSVKDLGF